MNCILSNAKSRSFPNVLIQNTRCDSMQVANVRISTSVEACEVGADVTFDEAQEGPFYLFYRFPREFVSDTTESLGDAFVAALLPVAMACAEPLVLEAPLTKELALSLDAIQNIYHEWEPLMSKIAVLPKREITGSPPIEASGIGLFFSLGVDSFYSLLANVNKPSTERITHLILVRGFDIPLNASYDRAFETALSAAQEVANHYSMSLVAVTTNVRQLADKFIPWGRIFHGAALASVGLAMRGALRQCYIASTCDDSHLKPWGSHPQLDPLWGTPKTTFVHDASDVSRLKKISYISNYRPPMEWLRVCYQNAEDCYNCGRCNKCVQTMVSLQLVHGLHRCKTLPNEINLALFDHIQTNQTVISSLFWQEIVDALGDSSVAPDLKLAVDRFLEQARSIVTPENSWMYQDWLALKQSVAAEMEPWIPPTAIVVVAGQESISRWITNSIRIHSFPEQDGVFWGAPADDATAIKYLAQARQKGSRYFLVDRECFWWLDYYKSLREYLDRSCDTIIRNDKMILLRFSE